MTQIEELTKKVEEFRDARNWKQFHNPKDLALSLVLESAELMEHFQWKNAEEMDKHILVNKGEISEELADVFYWTLLIAKDFNIDLEKALELKIDINNKKYPVEKAKNKHTKYTEL